MDIRDQNRSNPALELLQWVAGGWLKGTSYVEILLRAYKTMAYKPADRFNKAGNQYLREDKWLTKNVIEDESPSNGQWILM